MNNVTLVEEQNVVSLRTVYVHDDGNLVSFNLLPADIESWQPKRKGRKFASNDFEWASKDITWLYRHLRSASEENRLASGFSCIEKDLKPMAFGSAPAFKLLWTDSGNSVALFLNGELWAFICERNHQGYSKGILSPQTGNPWNQNLFEETFKTA